MSHNTRHLLYYLHGLFSDYNTSSPSGAAAIERKIKYDSRGEWWARYGGEIDTLLHGIKKGMKVPEAIDKLGEIIRDTEKADRMAIRGSPVSKPASAGGSPTSKMASASSIGPASAEILVSKEMVDRLVADRLGGERETPQWAAEIGVSMTDQLEKFFGTLIVNRLIDHEAYETIAYQISSSDGKEFDEVLGMLMSYM